jgi:glutamate formiminotransferase
VTPLHVVFDTVAQLAAEQGVGVERSELIGLTPARVMLAAAAHYLKLHGFHPASTVEEAIQQARAKIATR